ncbi:hypothetical protein J1614_006145, partial [Plenodomus biglobosus]
MRGRNDPSIPMVSEDAHHGQYSRMPLPDQANAEEVRHDAGLTPYQWDQICRQRITTEEAKKLREDDPNITWQNVDKGKRNQALDNINSELKQKNIPTVDLEVVAWRVSKALPKKSGELTGKSAPSSTAIASPEKTSRPFDPIRDL